MLAALVALILAQLLAATAALAAFPPLSGRVVDAANILSPATETQLTADLAALETRTRRQLVVATVPDLGGNDIADYGYRLGRAWGIGDATRNDGVILLVAPNERRMHIAVGYGLEPVITDALAATIIRNDITPRFREGDFDGGVTAGVNRLVRQLELPPEEAAAVAASAAREAEEPQNSAAFITLVIIFLILFAFVLPVLRDRGSMRRYRSGRSGAGPVVIWGPPVGGWGSGSGSSWGGGGFGGGFSGFGGSFGGGGASGGW